MSESTRNPASWRAVADLPQARSEVAVAEAGGLVHVVGGTALVDGEPHWATTLVTAYDPSADRWTERAPLPEPLTHVGLAGLGGRLYAFGGFTGIVHLDPRRAAYCYDPGRDEWTALPELPAALGSVGVAAVGGKLHVLGGRDSRQVVPLPGTPLELGLGTTNHHFTYDPERRTWAQAPPLPGPPRDHAGVVALDGRVHVVGGRVEDVDRNLDRHDVHDPRTGGWTTAAPLPAPRSAGATTVHSGLIVHAGGECGQGGSTFDDVHTYDPRTDRWTATTPLPHGRHGFGAATAAGRAYFVAGSPTCAGGAGADALELLLG
ncbi:MULTISPECIES: kelch repeat-containing protein [Actinosynnema]|uniref:Kelch repeat-containing protein n=1 Tax=Actinosynnema TaxID=40566 RepID=UPI0020A50BD4|nr:kelch repeat-containing protein [Actinosynnema pretiosum]MCP2096502.1 N-acetylneuraminic acid mutarotase [Actinosynnema pretiosum]